MKKLVLFFALIIPMGLSAQSIFRKGIEVGWWPGGYRVTVDSIVSTTGLNILFYSGGVALTPSIGGMIYPLAGIPVSTGLAWGASITDNSSNWNTAYTDRLKWDGGATGLVAATGRTSLGATTVGAAFFMLTNPGAITFPRINADNSITALSAANFKTALSLTSTDVGLNNLTNKAQVELEDSALMAGGYTSYADGSVTSSGLTAKLNKADSALMNGGYFSYSDGIIGLASKLNKADSALMAGGYTSYADGVAGLALKLNKADSINYAGGYMSRYDGVTGLALKAPIDKPTFTDTVTVDVLLTTGTISGTIGVTLDTDPAIVLSEADCKNRVRIKNDADAIDYTLPGAVAGLIVLFYDVAGGVITIDAAAGDEILLNGVGVGVADAIDSPGVIGNFISIMAIDGTRWITIGQSGIWIDGGAD